ncbi:4'-phosphopantetheinyl transferase [Gautieria morchelliformis]|nr:4'-phosphopantetheinyl transferase [Gautieria morchelliformis]
MAAMIIGIGTDILFLPRIVSLVKRRSAERFATRILSEEEHDQWRSLRNSAERLRYLAVRWAVKEAAYKALQPEVELKWKNMSFMKCSASTSRKPVLRVAQELTLGVKFHASVSHDGDHAIAMVVAEAKAHDSPTA